MKRYVAYFTIAVVVDAEDESDVEELARDEFIARYGTEASLAAVFGETETVARA